MHPEAALRRASSDLFIDDFTHTRDWRIMSMSGTGGILSTITRSFAPRCHECKTAVSVAIRCQRHSSIP